MSSTPRNATTKSSSRASRGRTGSASTPAPAAKTHAAVSGDHDHSEHEKRERRRSGARALKHTLLFGDGKPGKRGKAFWVAATGIVLAVVIAGSILMFTEIDIDWSRITGFIENLEPALVIPLMAVLPVVGFPISVVYLVAGARFGPLWGGVLVAGITAVHLLLTHLVATGLFRAPITRFIERRHRHLPNIPPDEHAAVAVIGALAPALPYVLRNYILALSGVRLWTYFWICLPIYTARSYVTILLGDLSSSPSGSRLIILLAVDAVKIGVCAGVIWWLRSHHKKRAAAAHASEEEKAA